MPRHLPHTGKSSATHVHVTVGWRSIAAHLIAGERNSCVLGVPRVPTAHSHRPPASSIKMMHLCLAWYRGLGRGRELPLADHRWCALVKPEKGRKQLPVRR
jgi:hypothetical protein